MTQKVVYRIIFFDQNSHSKKIIYGVVKASQLYSHECEWIVVKNLTVTIVAKTDIEEITVFKKERTFSIDKASLLVFDNIAEMEVE